ncbi:Uncharacterized protein DBV15_02036 [Temnothorax longispinosus]|uniref:Replication protein A 32 kDa subunit n=1 Tax=Temnothorax longispinosus TaxID=300112 RepID=A0A4S2KJ66_9HYME|nr:Uncharacterized protein DBV15_02036 [Temnothorax longispinosus]
MWNESSVGLGGGGFLDDSTQGDTSKKGPQSNEKTIVPVLIKHITSTTGDLQLAGRNVNIVSIVGILINIEQDTTKTSFTVQDDTGTITAVKWIEADKNPAEINCSMEVNTYVRVYGLIRTQNNQRHLLILRMLPLEDLNELTVHFMEVMYVILRAKKPAEERESILPTNNSLTDNTMSGMSREQIAVLEVVRSANEAECGIEKRDILGKCSLKEQLPTLRLLLDFMRKVYMEPFASTNETEGTPTDIIKLCIDDADQASSLSVIKPQISYVEAIKYFEESEKEMLNNDCGEIRPNLPEDLHAETDDRLVNEEQDALFDKEKEKFMEAFHTISSWPVKVKSLDKDISDSICSNIKSICSDFSSFKKVLQAKEEISNVKLAKGLPKTAAPLNAIIEDIVIYNEELRNLISNNIE